MSSSLVFMDSVAQMGASGWSEGFAQMGGGTPSMMGGATSSDIGGRNTNFRANTGVANHYIVNPLSQKGDEFSKHELLFLRRTKLDLYQATQTYYALTLSALNAYLRHAQPGQYKKVWDVNQVWRFGGVIDNIQPYANLSGARQRSNQLDINCVITSQVMCINYWQDGTFTHLPPESDRFITCRDKSRYLWLVLKQVEPDTSALGPKRPRRGPSAADADAGMEVKYAGMDIESGDAGTPSSATELGFLLMDQADQRDRAIELMETDKRSAQFLDAGVGMRPYWQYVPVCTPCATPPTLEEVYGRDAVAQGKTYQDYECILVGRSNFIYGVAEGLPGLTRNALYPHRSEEVPAQLSKLNQLLLLVE